MIRDKGTYRPLDAKSKVPGALNEIARSGGQNLQAVQHLAGDIARLKKHLQYNPTDGNAAKKLELAKVALSKLSTK